MVTLILLLTVIEMEILCLPSAYEYSALALASQLVARRALMCFPTIGVTIGETLNARSSHSKQNRIKPLIKVGEQD